MFKTLTTLRLSIAAAALCSLPSCELVSGFAGGEVGQALQGVQGLTSNITEWSSKLSSGSISDLALGQLGGFASNAGGLGETLKAALGGVDATVAKQVEPVQAGLSQLSNFKAEDAMKLDQSGRATEVQKFTGAAQELSGIVSGILGS